MDRIGRRGTWLVGLATAIACCGVARESAAQPVPLGDEVVVNAYTTGIQGEPAIASDGDGRFVVVWTSAATTNGAGTSIRGQRYDATGQPAGTEFEISAGVSSASGSSVAMQQDGSFVVAWRESTPAVYARAFDGQGTARGEPFRVDTTVFDYAHGYDHAYYDRKGPPAIAGSDAGEFMIVWSGGYNEYLYFLHSRRRILGRRLDTAGSLAGSEFRVAGDLYYYAFGPHVADGGSGRFVVAWSAVASYSYSYNDNVEYERVPHYEARSRNVDAADLPTGNEAVVGADASLAPKVASTATGHYVVVWPRGYATDGLEVAARRYDETGAALGEPLVVSSPSSDAQATTNAGAGGVDVSQSPDGGFAVVWASGGESYGGSSDGSSAGLFARSYASDGQAFGEEVPLNAYTTDAQWRPASAFVDADSLVVVWQSEGQDGSDAAVVARRFARAPACGDASADGQTAATDALVVLSAVVGLRSCPLCVCDADASTTVTVTDALRILRAATGQQGLLDCAPC